MQTHRAYAMAGEGFPYWMELTAADRLMTSLPLFPHQRARVLGDGVAGLRRRVGAGAAVLGQRVPRRGPPARRDRVQRDRGDARDPDAPARAARRRRHAAAAVLHRAPRPRGSGSWRSRRRFGLRMVVGYAMSESPYGLIWPHGTRPFGTPGLRPASIRTSAPSTRRGSSDEDGGDAGPGEIGRAAAAQPRRHARVLGRCRRRRPRSARRRLAAHGRPRHGERRRDATRSSRGEGGAAAAWPEPVAARGGGSDRRRTPTCSSARSSACRRSCRRRRSRRSWCAAEGGSWTSPSCVRAPLTGSRRSRCRDTGRRSSELPQDADRPGRQAPAAQRASARASMTRTDGRR